MNRKHIHSFRKIGGKLYCIFPTCSQKCTLGEIDGQLIRCSQCQSEFLFDVTTYNEQSLQLSCHSCDPTKPYHLTLEGQRSILGEILFDQITDSLKAKYKEYNSKFTKLIDFERRLGVREEKVQEKESSLRVQRDRLAKTFRDRRVKLYAQLAIEKQKLTPQIPQITPDANEAGEAVLRLLDKIYKGDPN